MFLEDHGFRFVEMVLHPVFDKLQSTELPESDLGISRVSRGDLDRVLDMMESAFRFERFHMDPRLNPTLADVRDRNWVDSAFADQNQELYEICDKQQIVAIFMVEQLTEDSTYWHLSAVPPEFQGRGYGERTWRAMMRHHQKHGSTTVTTTITARNTPVLNLYAKLNFRLLPPEMTFHWVANSVS